MENQKTVDRWHEAREHLNAVIAEYVDVGIVGSFALKLTLLPLKHRLDGGERTDELYDEIMGCE